MIAEVRFEKYRNVMQTVVNDIEYANGDTYDISLSDGDCSTWIGLQLFLRDNEVDDIYVYDCGVNDDYDDFIILVRDIAYIMNLGFEVLK